MDYGQKRGVVVRETKGDWDRKFHVENLVEAQQDVPWSAEGSQFAACGDDGAVRLWDMTTWRPGRVFRGHTGTVWSVSWSPDGQVFIWDS